MTKAQIGSALELELVMKDIELRMEKQEVFYAEMWALGPPAILLIPVILKIMV